MAQRDNGAIVIDEEFRTSESNIFALGDVTDRLQLTPVAIGEAMCFASTQFLGQRKVMAYDNVATAVFCSIKQFISGVNLTVEGIVKRADNAYTNGNINVVITYINILGTNEITHGIH